MAYFNPQRPSYIADPYPALARLRAEAPVFYSEPHEAWIVTSYGECLALLHDDETYASDPAHSTGRVGERIRHQREGQVLGDTPRIGQSDASVHARLRGAVAAAFTPRYVEGVRGFVEREVIALLDGVLRADEPFDVLNEFGALLPRAVIGVQLGAPEADRAQILAWATALMQTVNADLTPARRTEAEAARDGLLGYLGRVGRGEAGDPESLIAAMARAEGDAGRLTGAELLALTIDVALAGNDTTANLIGNGVIALASHPAEEARLRVEPDWETAVDEMLRYDPPQQVIARFTTRPTILRGKRIPAGATVLAHVAAANRDPVTFPEPERFDVARRGERHLSFGMGVHHCVGAPLAKIEAEAAFRALFERLTMLRPAPGMAFPRGPDWMLRSAGAVPLLTGELFRG
ncbi:MAG: cytochrome P450 [Dehalococcoidia bacterium]|nr:MAG: cytochrome P450 [Dehalococcoidia bacterium]